MSTSQWRLDWPVLWRHNSIIVGGPQNFQCPLVSMIIEIVRVTRVLASCLMHSDNSAFSDIILHLVPRGWTGKKWRNALPGSVRRHRRSRHCTCEHLRNEKITGWLYGNGTLLQSALKLLDGENSVKVHHDRKEVTSVFSNKITNKATNDQGEKTSCWKGTYPH